MKKSKRKIHVKKARIVSLTVVLSMFFQSSIFCFSAISDEFESELCHDDECCDEAKTRNPRTAVVNHFFDDGYTMRYYGDQSAAAKNNSRLAINGYMNVVAGRFDDLFNLQIRSRNINGTIRTEGARHFRSPADLCSTKLFNVVSCGALNCNHSNAANCNINARCLPACGGNHTVGYTLSWPPPVHNYFNNYLNAAPEDRRGNHVWTNVYWSGHRFFIGATNDDVPYEAFAQPVWYGCDFDSVYMLGKGWADLPNITDWSQLVLMHELGHSFGAHDHWHDTDQFLGDRCNKPHCAFSRCNPLPCDLVECVAPTTRRPSTCLMAGSAGKNIFNSNIFCANCTTEIDNHINNHH